MPQNEKSTHQPDLSIPPHAADDHRLDAIMPGPGTVTPPGPWTEPTPEDCPPPARIVGGSEDRRRLMTALAAAQGEMTNAKKSRDNQFKGKYADLAELADVARKPLSRHQIAVTQTPRLTGDHEFALVMEITHGPSGQYIQGDWPLDPALRKDQQKLMAQITYSKRGLLGAMLFIVAEDDSFDDDGEAAASATMPEREGEKVPAPAHKSAAVREAEEWGGWAKRKIPQIDSRDQVSEFEEKYRPSMISLAKVAPELHADVTKAIQDRMDDLTPPADEGNG